MPSRFFFLVGHSSRHDGPKTALRSDGGLGGAAVSVIGGPGLAVGTAAGVEAALHRSHASHPHGLMESVALVLQGRQVKICNTKAACTDRSNRWGWWAIHSYNLIADLLILIFHRMND